MQRNERVVEGNGRNKVALKSMIYMPNQSCYQSCFVLLACSSCNCISCSVSETVRTLAGTKTSISATFQQLSSFSTNVHMLECSDIYIYIYIYIYTCKHLYRNAHNRTTVFVIMNTLFQSV